MTKFLGFFRKKLNFENLIAIIFFINSFALSFCSLRTSLAKITWLTTAALLILILIYCLRKKIVIDSFHFILFSLGMVMILGSALNLFKKFKFEQLLYLIVVFFVYTFIKMNKDKISIFLTSFMLGTLLFSVFFILYNLDAIKNISNLYRVDGHFGDQNDIAMFFGIGCCINFYFIFCHKKIYVKIFNICSFAVFALCGVLTGSKIFLIALFLAIVAFIFLFFGKKRWYISLGIFLFVTFIVVLFLSLPFENPLKTRLLSFLSTFFNPSSGGDASTNDRLNLFKCGVRFWLDRPLVGYGINGFANNGYNGAWSHNSYSEILCNYGVIGFLLFFEPFFNLIKNLGKQYKKIELSIYILIFFFIGCTFSVSLEVEKSFMYLLGFLATCGSYTDIFVFEKFQFKKIFKIIKKGDDFNEYLHIDI